MVVGHEHWAVANLLIGRYGRQAATQAEARAENAGAKGDREGTGDLAKRRGSARTGHRLCRSVQIENRYQRRLQWLADSD